MRVSAATRHQHLGYSCELGVVQVEGSPMLTPSIENLNAQEVVWARHTHKFMGDSKLGKGKISSHSIIHSTDIWVTETPLPQFPQEVMGFLRKQAQVETQSTLPCRWQGQGKLHRGVTLGLP